MENFFVDLVCFVFGGSFICVWAYLIPDLGNFFYSFTEDNLCDCETFTHISKVSIALFSCSAPGSVQFWFSWNFKIPLSCLRLILFYSFFVFIFWLVWYWFFWIHGLFVLFNQFQYWPLLCDFIFWENTYFWWFFSALKLTESSICNMQV